jgi:hypothetical protein
MSSRVPLATLLTAISCFGVVSCTSVLGIDDTQLESAKAVEPPKEPVDKGRTIDFRYYFAPQLSQDVTLPPVVLANFQGLKVYLGAVQASPNPQRGYLSATVVGCDQSFSKGVELRSNPPLLGTEGVTNFHFRGDNPTSGVPTATTTVPSSDGSGPIGYLNVPPTQYELLAVEKGKSDDEAISSRSVFVTENVFSTVLMLPKGCPPNPTPMEPDKLTISIPNVWVFPEVGKPAEGIRFEICTRATTTDCEPLQDPVLSGPEGATIVIGQTTFSGYLRITDGSAEDAP